MIFAERERLPPRFGEVVSFSAKTEKILWNKLLTTLFDAVESYGRELHNEENRRASEEDLEEVLDSRSCDRAFL